MTKFDDSVKQFKKAIEAVRAYAKEEDDPEMRKLYRDDARDLSKVLTRYKNMKFKEAMSMAWHLDTACRDYIPDSAWDIMKEFD